MCTLVFVFLLIELYLLSALRIVSRLHGALISQFTRRQSYHHLGQGLQLCKIQHHLMKGGCIAWRKDKLELQKFHFLIGRGIHDDFCLSWCFFVLYPHDNASQSISGSWDVSCSVFVCHTRKYTKAVEEGIYLFFCFLWG